MSSIPKDVMDNISEGIQAMGVTPRTQGDGMEVPQEKPEVKTRLRLGDALIYHPTDLRQLSTIPPVTPTGTIVNLVPKHIVPHREDRQLLHSLKTKEPKFVPYEPYKAAVNPIVPDKRNRRPPSVHLGFKVSQLTALKLSGTTAHAQTETKELKKADSEKVEWEKEKKLLETDVQRLKEENSQLENQLKFQAQVNGELKNLLVAAVGEDLETKVHLLTEDKLQLARALLNSAQHLSTHQEQIEWLAGQCEVWRSKFLASSLMVEELAKWKAALCQRTTDLQEAIKRLLEDRKVIRDSSLKTYRTLSVLRHYFDPVGAAASRKTDLHSTNAVDLTQGCSQLADILKIQLLNGVETTNSQKEPDFTGLDMKTVAERMAEQLVAAKLLVSGRQDVACSAVMGAAVAVGGQIFLPKSECNITCCPHCSGEIKQI